MAPEIVTLVVNNQEWSGWTECSIAAGIERLSRDFNVQISRRWPGAKGKPKINKGDSVEIFIGSDKVITGFVEATPITYDAKSVSFGIVGRSKTCDLVDCSIVSQQFSGQSLVQIMTSIAAPFSLSVVDLGVPKTALQGVQIDFGESGMDVINKLLGLQQVLAYDDPLGRIVVSPAGSKNADTALVLGKNILTCDTEQSIKDRFSEYQVAGQRAGNNQDFGKATLSAIRAKTSDAGVTRYRPMIIRQTGNATTQSCSDRSAFEMARRQARTDEVTYTVQGWRQGSGKLWTPNELVTVFDPVVGFDNHQLLIAEVTFQQGAGGTTASLRVGPPDAYLPELDEAAKKKKQKKRDTAYEDF